MFAKIAVLACALAIANAGVIPTEVGYAAPAAYAAPAPAHYAAPAAYAASAVPAYSSYPAPAYTSYAAPAAAVNYAAPATAVEYAAPAGYGAYSAPTVTATSENVYRSAGNLNTISTHSKSIATPFSTSNKHFTSVTNPGVYAQASPITYAAPAAPVSYSAPAVAAHHAAPAVAHHGSSLLGVAYSPAVEVSHMTYSSPYGINYSY